MKKVILLIISIGFTYHINAQFTETTTELITSKEIVSPVLRLSNELRLANTFAPNDPIIGTLDNTGYGINIHKTEGIGFAFNNVHRVFFTPNGNIRTSSANPSIHIQGTGTGNYQGANLILSAKGVTSENKHVSTWFMTHRGVNGTAAIEMQRRGRNNEYNGSLLTYSDGDGWRFNIAANRASGVSNALFIKNTGNIGIGTSTPMARLHINSNADVGRGQNPALLIGTRNGLHIAIDNNEIGAFSNNSNSDLYINGSQSTSNTIINGDGIGKVGIGTTTPDSKLTVKGKIHAEEVKIDLSVPAPDYVFKKEYHLLTIEEVQQHIATNGHLPNIPSAKEMEKNGVKLGVMNMKLLEKIEELTLYTIQQQKELKAQKKEIKMLQNEKHRINELEKKLETLSKLTQN